MFEKLKQRWGLKTNWDVIAVLIVFSLAGSSSVFIRKPVFHWLDVSKETTPMLEYISLYLMILTPAYQLLFLFWGAVWRQWEFVWMFEQKIFKRMLYVEILAVLVYIGLKIF